MNDDDETALQELATFRGLKLERYQPNRSIPPRYRLTDLEDATSDPEYELSLQDVVTILNSRNPVDAPS